VHTLSDQLEQLAVGVVIELLDVYACSVVAYKAFFE
jgi:hypothetical protein